MLNIEHITKIYSDFVVKTTYDYLNKYQHVSDSALTKLFDLCHESINSATSELGWKEAKIVYLSNDTNYVMDHNNLPSKITKTEQIVVNKLKHGNENVALVTEGKTYTVGVSFYNQTQTNKVTINGCLECHRRLLTNQKRFNEDTDPKIEAKHINGAIIYQIPSKG